jgi:hypothetical protein
MTGHILCNTSIISLGGLSGWLIYFIINDFNKIYIKRKDIYPEKFNSLHTIFNPGFIIGTGLGIYYAYKGRILINNIYLICKNICKNQLSITGAK